MKRRLLFVCAVMSAFAIAVACSTPDDATTPDADGGDAEASAGAGAASWTALLAFANLSSTDAGFASATSCFYVDDVRLTSK